MINEFVPEFNGQTEVKVEEASLANIFQLGTRLTYFSLFIPELAGARAVRFPSEHGEGSLTDFTLSTEFRLSHSQVRVITQTSFAKDREVRLLPSLLIQIAFKRSASFTHFQFINYN